VLSIVVAGLGWAMRSTKATQKPPLTGEVSPSDPAIADEPQVEIPQASKDEGMHTSNPFTLSDDGPRPKIVIDELKHDFDRLAVGATGHHDFTLRNEGDAVLTLAKGESTCKCTVFNIGAAEIPPGGSAKVHLEWKPPHASKIFEQSASVWTNDPDQPKLELTVEGSVVPLISRIPEGVWTVGTLTEGQPTTASGVIASALMDDFEVEGVESTSENVQITYERLSEEELKRLDARCGYALKCSISPNMPVGTFVESVKVLLSLPEAPVVQFDVQGARIGPYQIIGPGWTQERHTLAMGRCQAEQGKSTRVSLFVVVPDGFDLKFEEPIVTPPVLQVALKRDETFTTSGGRQRFYVTATAPPGMTPGRWSGDTAIKVELNCNHPAVTKAVFKIEFQAD